MKHTELKRILAELREIDFYHYAQWGDSSHGESIISNTISDIESAIKTLSPGDIVYHVETGEEFIILEINNEVLLVWDAIEHETVSFSSKWVTK